MLVVEYFRPCTPIHRILHSSTCVSEVELPVSCFKTHTLAKVKLLIKLRVFTKLSNNKFASKCDVIYYVECNCNFFLYYAVGRGTTRWIKTDNLWVFPIAQVNQHDCLIHVLLLWQEHSDDLYLSRKFCLSLSLFLSFSLFLSLSLCLCICTCAHRLIPKKSPNQ